MLKGLLWFPAWCLSSFYLLAQQATTHPAAPQQNNLPSPYSLRVQSRLVIEDVSVLDGQGKPVTGLPASAFHVTDNTRPQTLQEVQETTGNSAPADAAAPPPTQPSGTFSNEGMYRNQGSVTVLLIDPSTMLLEDQLYLRVQALKFIESASSNTSMAVFRVSSAGIPVLLQPLTRNKAQLAAAVSATVPVLSRPVQSTFSNAIIQLANISGYLRAIPGRKAVLWLAGAFPLYQPPDFGGPCGYPQGASCGNRPTGQHLRAEQDAYRALQEARVAVYPIDTRGVQMGGLTAVPVLDRGPSVTPGNIGAKPTSESERVTGQYDEMDRLATATGGRAFYSNNHVATMLNQALQLTSSGYTLTYHPTDEAMDGKWHSVTIRVDGGYSLHYREGYYADDANATPSGTPRRRLTAEDPSPAVNAPSDAQALARPLIFSAHVVSQTTSGKAREVKVRYVIPQDQLSFDGKPSGHAHFQLAALAYNANGDVLSNAVQIVDTHYSAEQIKLADRIGTPADQTILVAKGANYLLLAVEDLSTQRVGVVQLPLSQVPHDAGTAASNLPR